MNKATLAQKLSSKTVINASEYVTSQRMKRRMTKQASLEKFSYAWPENIKETKKPTTLRRKQQLQLSKPVTRANSTLFSTISGMENEFRSLETICLNFSQFQLEIKLGNIVEVNLQPKTLTGMVHQQSTDDVAHGNYLRKQIKLEHT